MSASLDDIYALALDIQAQVWRSRFGFQHLSRGRRTIYVGREEFAQTPWYFWLGGDIKRRDPIVENSIVAYIVGLEVFSERQYKGADLIKLTCYLNTPLGNYRLQSGWNNEDPSKTTVASRGLVCALACLTPEQFRQPLTIVCSGGNDEPKAVFLNILAGDKPVFFDRPSNDDWPGMQQGILQAAIANISAVWGDASQYRNKKGEFDEDDGPPAVKSVPVAAASKPTAKSKSMVRPATTSRAHQGTFTQKSLVVHVGKERGLEQNTLIALIKKALAIAQQPEDTQLDTLAPEAYLNFFDAFLLGWAMSIRVQGAEEGLVEPLFMSQEEAEEAYSKMLSMYESSTPYQRYIGWTTWIDNLLEPEDD